MASFQQGGRGKSWRKNPHKEEIQGRRKGEDCGPSILGLRRRTPGHIRGSHQMLPEGQRSHGEGEEKRGRIKVRGQKLLG